MHVIIDFNTSIYYCKKGKWKQAYQEYPHSEKKPSQTAKICREKGGIDLCIDQLKEGETPHSFLQKWEPEGLPRWIGHFQNICKLPNFFLNCSELSVSYVPECIYYKGNLYYECDVKSASPFGAHLIHSLVWKFNIYTSPWFSYL